MFCRARAVKGNRSQVTESLCTVKGTLLQIQIFSQSELQYCSVSLVNINRQSVFIAYGNWSLWSETKHKKRVLNVGYPKAEPSTHTVDFGRTTFTSALRQTEEYRQQQ